MSQFRLRLCICVAVPLLASVMIRAQMPPYIHAGPVPAAILAARTLFVSNGGSDSGLFPEPFSGDPDRPYTQLSMPPLRPRAITRWLATPPRPTWSCSSG